jgi:hypothetical protein
MVGIGVTERNAADHAPIVANAEVLANRREESSLLIDNGDVYKFAPRA